MNQTRLKCKTTKKNYKKQLLPILSILSLLGFSMHIKAVGAEVKSEVIDVYNRDNISSIELLNSHRNATEQAQRAQQAQEQLAQEGRANKNPKGEASNDKFSLKQNSDQSLNLSDQEKLNKYASSAPQKNVDANVGRFVTPAALLDSVLQETANGKSSFFASDKDNYLNALSEARTPA